MALTLVGFLLMESSSLNSSGGMWLKKSHDQRSTPWGETRQTTISSTSSVGNSQSLRSGGRISLADSTLVVEAFCWLGAAAHGGRYEERRLGTEDLATELLGGGVVFCAVL